MNYINLSKGSTLPPPWFTDEEVDEICSGLQNNSSKVRYLRSLGLTVNQKPNGRPLVMRHHAEAVLAGLSAVQNDADKQTRNGPNKAALIARFGKKRGLN